jgi:hypothetical protein
MHRSIVSMRSATVISVAVVALLSSTSSSQSTNPTDFDASAAEKYFKDGSALAKNRFSKPLRDYEQGPDGARGFGVENPIVRPIALDHIPKPFTSKLEYYSFFDYCQFDAIVLAVNIDSTPVLNGDKDLIYTVSHFTVLDAIKSDVPFTRGQALVAYRLGGDVDDGTEKLIISTPDMSTFEPTKTYLLNLERDKSASVPQYVLPLNLTIDVRNNKVYPVWGRFAWLTGWPAFPSGTPYTKIKNTFAKAVKLQADCSRI